MRSHWQCPHERSAWNPSSAAAHCGAFPRSGRMKMRCSAMPLLLCTFLLGSAGYPFKPAVDVDVTPRTTILCSGLLGAQRFSSSALNYSTLLLEDKTGILYVGARGTLFALNTSNIADGSTRTIHWEAPADKKKDCHAKGRNNKTECFNHIRFLQRFNETHLYTCGTHAFHPLCAYIDTEQFRLSSGFEEGSEKCPYDPAKGYTGLLVDGEMYTATQYEFRSVPDIRRNIPQPMLKTEETPTRWLDEANFVGSAMLRESVDSSIGDDDKVYFFFTEKSDEESSYFSQSKVARVARVCRGDWGGLWTLQKKWTSFLKARLVCSIPDYDFHFNILRSVFVQEAGAGGWQDSLFYGVFGSQWKNVKASAICKFSIKDIQEAFNGAYMEKQESSPEWNRYSGVVPEPRPGSCITDTFRAKSFNISRDLPDNVLEFVRRHPLMFQQVRPQEERPLLFKRGVDYTRIAVDRVTALDGRTYDVLFIGTDDGWLHKALEIGSKVHIIEEMQLFEEPQPIENLVISQQQRSVFVGSQSGVLQLPLSACHRYTSCFDCIFTRDPYCSWDGTGCSETTLHTDRSNLTQDIHNGNSGCLNTSGEAPLLHQKRTVLRGGDVLLQCELSSNLAVPAWTLNGSELAGYGPAGYRVGTDGLLIVESRPEQSGNYSCYSVENGVRVWVRTYAVSVRTELLPQPWKPPTPATPPAPTSQPSLPSELPPLAPAPPRSEYQTFRSMEGLYITLITVLAGVCFVLTVVLLFLAFCVQNRRGRYSLQGSGRIKRGDGSLLELQTISSNCAGKPEGESPEGLLQIVPGEAQVSPNKDPPPPPPPPPPLPSSEFTNGISATLPSVLRKMNGNSYVLLRQSESESTSPLYHSFTEELNKILEKRKQTPLGEKPDESSV
ncbi:semaphorin-4G-like [Polyodon spathula]|uniref:semaphorin-4G-like n=1 Tax=Polyodon spathula TaxID=7913 RepID=UPI001B7F4AFE|nr:semaphorin-4G-like [Polyodon spathula]